MCRPISSTNILLFIYYFFFERKRRGIAFKFQLPLTLVLTVSLWIWPGEIVLDEVAVKMEKYNSLSLFHIRLFDVADLRQNGQEREREEMRSRVKQKIKITFRHLLDLSSCSTFKI